MCRPINQSHVSLWETSTKLTDSPSHMGGTTVRRNNGEAVRRQEGDMVGYDSWYLGIWERAY